ncbi:MAG: peptidoglycan DD-metalloendopeptidase family protein [bacterium]|nr:peptidoglycan DD-metalloendopeptidase family protein [bacterium]
MNKLFYFSKTNLKYIEIKSFKLKLFAMLLALSLFFAALYVLVYYFIGIGNNPDITITSLKNENRALKKEIERLSESYSELLTDVEDISELNSELRISANLEPISDEERMLGVGGSENYLSTNLNIRDAEVQNLLSSVNEMIREIEFEKSQTAEIAEKLRLNEELYNSIPAILPAPGNYSIHDFGMRRHPILGVRRFHHGIDINCNTGTEILCPGNGKVIVVERQAGFGLVVEIDHGFGYKTVYAHLSKAVVKVGEKVKRGQVIAKSGNSGLSSGPHLHYEVHHNGITLDPTDFFFDDLTFFDLDTSTISLTEK